MKAPLRYLAVIKKHQIEDGIVYRKEVRKDLEIPENTLGNVLKKLRQQKLIRVHGQRKSRKIKIFGKKMNIFTQSMKDSSDYIIFQNNVSPLNIIYGSLDITSSKDSSRLQYSMKVVPSSFEHLWLYERLLIDLTQQQLLLDQGLQVNHKKPCL